MKSKCLTVLGLVCLVGCAGTTAEDQAHEVEADDATTERPATESVRTTSSALFVGDTPRTMRFSDWLKWIKDVDGGHPE